MTYRGRMVLAAVTTDTIKTYGVGAIVVLLIAALVFAVVVKAIVTKIIGLVVTIGLAFLVYTQRSNIEHCVSEAKATYQSQSLPASGKLTCNLLGRKVEIPISKIVGP